MKNLYKYYLPVLFVCAFICSGCAEQGGGFNYSQWEKSSTVDKDFSIAEAAAVKDGKFMQVGTESFGSRERRPGYDGGGPWRQDGASRVQ